MYDAAVVDGSLESVPWAQSRGRILAREPNSTDMEVVDISQAEARRGPRSSGPHPDSLLLGNAWSSFSLGAARNFGSRPRCVVGICAALLMSSVIATRILRHAAVRESASFAGSLTLTGKGCRNWEEIILAMNVAEDAVDCGNQCKQTPGCNYFNYQFDECSWFSGNSRGSCYLFSGDCDIEDSVCWDLYQVELPMPAAFQRSSTGTGCRNWDQIEFARLNVHNAGHCSQECSRHFEQCVGFSFQKTEECVGQQADGGRGTCILYSGECEKGFNNCWDLYSKVKPQGCPAVRTPTTGAVAAFKQEVPISEGNVDAFTIGQDIMLVCPSYTVTRRIVNIVAAVLIVTPPLPEECAMPAVVMPASEAGVRGACLPQDDRCLHYENMSKAPCSVKDLYWCGYNPTYSALSQTFSFSTLASCNRGVWSIAVFDSSGGERLEQEEALSTHFWHCDGLSCDKRILDPFDEGKFIMSSGYVPQDPQQFPGGAVYGERLWMIGAFSDNLAKTLGPDECCGAEPAGAGACGECLLVQAASALKSNWRAVVMKKGGCRPGDNRCDTGFVVDVAVPGFGDFQIDSTHNVCDKKPGTGLSMDQSSVNGEWSVSGCDDTVQCMDVCDQLPQGPFRDGCRRFSLWGWTKDNPELTFLPVPCPAEFVKLVSSSFGVGGATSSQ